MRVFVLALDGCEVGFVERWRLRGLMQRTYGSVQVPGECFARILGRDGRIIHEPYTPMVWYAFITGTLPKGRIGRLLRRRRWTNPVVDKLVDVFARGWGLERRFGILRRMGFKRRVVDRRDYGVPTIFDHARKPHAIDVPAYSPMWNLGIYEGEFGFDKIPNVIRQAFKRFEDKKRRVAEILGSDWDLIMVWTKLLDIVGELAFGLPEMYRAYRAADAYVQELSRELGDDCVLLVVSDHGMKRLEGTRSFGMHTDRAFWSLNFETDWRPKSVTDFYGKIVEWLRS